MFHLFPSSFLPSLSLSLSHSFIPLLPSPPFFLYYHEFLHLFPPLFFISSRPNSRQGFYLPPPCQFLFYTTSRKLLHRRVLCLPSRELSFVICLLAVVSNLVSRRLRLQRTFARILRATSILPATIKPTELSETTVSELYARRYTGSIIGRLISRILAAFAMLFPFFFLQRGSHYSRFPSSLLLQQRRAEEGKKEGAEETRQKRQQRRKRRRRTIPSELTVPAEK